MFDELLQQANCVVFDIETTGFGRDARIVELAAVRLEQWQPVEEWQTLVNPQIPIPSMASRVHHIDDAMVAEAPTFSAVSSSFLHLLRDAVLVGHNIFTFDLHVLQRHLRDLLGVCPELTAVDTLPLTRKLFPLPSHKLGRLAEHLQIPLIAHHAMSDVYATAEIWLHLHELLLKRGMRCLGDLEHFRAVRHSEGPALPSFPEPPAAPLQPRVAS